MWPIIKLQLLKKTLAVIKSYNSIVGEFNYVMEDVVNEVLGESSISALAVLYYIYNMVIHQC